MADTNAGAPTRGLTDENIIDIPGLASRWVRLADGRRAHYVTAGDKGPAVVLFHGGIEGSSGTAGWRFMAPYLAANGFRVYCPDQPGFGLSDISNPAYLDTSPKAKNDFVKMFLDALCIDKAHISGNSMGCQTVLNFVISNPERVQSVLFIAGVMGDICEVPRIMGKDGKFTSNPNMPSLPEAVTWDGTKQGMQDLMDGIIYEKKAVSPELVEMRFQAATRQREARAKLGIPSGPMARQNATPDNLQVFSTKGRLDKLTVPMIYLYGLQDVLLPVENAFAQEDVVPNIQLFYPQECGHQGQTDRPDLFNQVALEFFSTGKVTWPTAVKAGVSLRRPVMSRYVEEPKGGFPKPIPQAYIDPPTLNAALKGAGLTPA
ncbi:MAG: alpha/beta hydrolase [Hyphomonadaceae bacterium]|nr:alpha/beta hydrolase [Hyphomonadaceae bacterium]